MCRKRLASGGGEVPAVGGAVDGVGGGDDLDLVGVEVQVSDDPVVHDGEHGLLHGVRHRCQLVEEEDAAGVGGGEVLGPARGFEAHTVEGDDG